MPLLFTPVMVPVAASYNRTKESPPKLHMGTRVTVSTAATARAASKALPPSWSTVMPALAARGEFEQTIPRRP
jgi:hypothetical protein